jgi:AcrR family transcriptional regulator
LKALQPRRQRTRDALVGAGRRLYARRPLDSVSIDELVAAAGVGKGSFYNHFTDRDALAAAVMLQIRAELDQRVRDTNTGITDPAVRVARALATYWRYALDEAEGARALARLHGPEASPQAPQNALVVADLADGLACSRFRIPTLEAGLILVVGMGMMGLIRLVQEPSAAVPLAQQLGQVTLVGLGLERADAALLAAQAADSVVRAAAPL